VAALGCLPPTVEPRATEHVAEMRTMIERLIKSGNAYVADDHVLFSVPSMPDYGRLSKRPLDEMIAGARVEVAPYKRDPQDFVLWKPSKPGEPAWPSPAGIKTPGRPGWHIECSAMSWKYLGEVFDIHGGGIDLVFPHHENEIAQSEAATGKTFACNWVENGLVLLRGAKMSKSDQHFFLVEDVAKQVEPEVIRYYLQSTHYRSPIEWNEDRLREAGIAYARLRSALETGEKAGGASLPESEKPKGLRADALKTEKRFEEAMEDDFNSAKAQGLLFDLAKSINRVAESGGKDDGERSDLAFATQTLRRLGETLGLFWDGKPREEEVPEEVQALARQRDEARLQKQWQRADELRDQILSLGYVLEDQKGGTRARRKL
jgi:cysteinyl-tRNA synthetase